MPKVNSVFHCGAFELMITGVLNSCPLFSQYVELLISTCSARFNEPKVNAYSKIFDNQVQMPHEPPQTPYKPVTCRGCMNLAYASPGSGGE
jgi:hypothetical protein